MGADPVAMCGNCREVKGGEGFHLTSCVGCINEYFSTDINEKEGRVLTKVNLPNAKVKSDFAPHCSMEQPCESMRKLVSCLKNEHRVLIDPCW